MEEWWQGPEVRMERFLHFYVLATRSGDPMQAQKKTINGQKPVKPAWPMPEEYTRATWTLAL
jgi:hypothetical protein